MMADAGVPTFPSGDEGDEEVTQEQMDTIGAWMKEQRELQQKVLGQWLKDVEGRINAHTDAKIAEVLAKVK